MSDHYNTPGVYIEEQTGPGVITGVGTSTAAFIGPAFSGSINEARYITSWDQFIAEYGRLDQDDRPEVYITTPRNFYMAHVVRGFFDNGGQFAYIVRIGTAGRAFFNLPDQGGTGNALHVKALKEGSDGDNITVEVKHSNLASGLEAARASANISNASGNLVIVNNAADFRPGDIITRNNTTERQAIERINYNTNEIFLSGNLTATYNSGTLRIANLQVGQRTFRLADTTGLHAGSVVTIKKGSTSETASAASVRDGFITLEQGLSNDYKLTGTAVTVESHEFILIFNASGATTESFDNLSMNRRHPRFYKSLVTSNHVTVSAGDLPTTSNPPDDRPAVVAATNLTGGKDDELAAIGSTEYQNGINALNLVDDVNFISIPDIQDSGLQNDLITHCLNKGDRFAILDAPQGLDPSAVLLHRKEVESERGFAALYYPWLEIRDPTSSNGERMLIPPSGHMAGIYARVDARGVHRAPANELVRGAPSLERVITHNQQAKLNQNGVNVIRILPGQARPVIWGARTTVRTDVTDWIYINKRRLMFYIEESIEEGIRWAVFAPNDLALWQQLKRTISEFLTRVWRDGALFGETAEKAFYVRIDETLNPQSARALGQLYIEIGVCAVAPAEFIIIRISLWDEGSEVAET